MSSYLAVSPLIWKSVMEIIRKKCLTAAKTITRTIQLEPAQQDIFYLIILYTLEYIPQSTKHIFLHPPTRAHSLIHWNLKTANPASDHSEVLINTASPPLTQFTLQDPAPRPHRDSTYTYTYIYITDATFSEPSQPFSEPQN